MRQVGAAGGNSVRVWVHVEGENSPQFDDDGFVIGTDASQTLISDLREFLDECQANGIFMDLVSKIFCRNEKVEIFHVTFQTAGPLEWGCHKKL